PCRKGIPPSRAQVQFYRHRLDQQTGKFLSAAKDSNSSAVSMCRELLKPYSQPGPVQQHAAIEMIPYSGNVLFPKRSFGLEERCSFPKLFPRHFLRKRSQFFPALKFGRQPGRVHRALYPATRDRAEEHAPTSTLFRVTLH